MTNKDILDFDWLWSTVAMVVVSEWQVVIDDKFYEMGPMTLMVKTEYSHQYTMAPPLLCLHPLHRPAIPQALSDFCNIQIVKGELRNRFNIILEERVKNFWTKQWKPDKNWLKNKEVMTFWSFANFHKTFLDQSIWICKWASWWCHRLTICHIFCT